MLQACCFLRRRQQGSWGELQHTQRCIQAVHAKKWRTELALHSSLQIFFVSWQREMLNNVRKCQVSWRLLTLQSNCLVLRVLSVMAVSPPKMKPGCSCNEKPQAASSYALPNLITRQGCSQRLKTLCLGPDPLFHMTVLAPVSVGQSALAVPRHWWPFAWVARSGPCHSILLTWCPLGVSVPSPGLQRRLIAEKHCVPQTCLFAPLQASWGG